MVVPQPKVDLTLGHEGEDNFAKPPSVWKKSRHSQSCRKGDAPKVCVSQNPDTDSACNL